MKPVLVVVVDVFPGSHQESARSCCRITNCVGPGGTGHIDHHTDDVAGRTKLAIGAGGGNFGQQILVKIPFRVAVVHSDLIDHLDHLVQKPRGGDHKGRPFHVLPKHPCFAADLFHMLKDREVVVIDLRHRKQLKHRLWILVFKIGPAEDMLVFRVPYVFHGNSRQVGFFLFELLPFVQTAQEDQIRHLFDHGQWIGHAARPEGFPYFIDLGFEFTCYHEIHFILECLKYKRKWNASSLRDWSIRTPYGRMSGGTLALQDQPTSMWD